ncbi:MAG TPA: saccharopine dehydrogenase NADP-binding domain-containing protein [Thermoleophilia bacterium]|nr:saccharopine dehydrogenase NADP-binding domain-containing protein [Thermoleophilia bacterium]
MSMRILQLGVGSVGEVTARTVASAPEVSAVVLADLDASRPQAVAGKLPPGKAELLQLDVHDKEALVKALAGVDLVINGLIPEVNLDVMAACLEAGTHYLDMAAAGPRDVVGTADVDEELALSDAFKKAGLTGLVFFGIDPGASDVFARTLYDQLDTVERLMVLDGDASSADGVEFAPSFSPTTMVEECLILPPHAYEDGRKIRRTSLSSKFDFTFPDPVGPLTVWNVDHEESQLMPLFLGDKGLRNADFYIALDEGWANLLLAWRKLGFDHNREIEFGGARFRPLDLLVSRLPRSVDLIGRMHGAVCVGTLAEGSVGGRRVRRFMYQITSHDEAYEKHGVQGTGWQTGVPAACAAIMLARGLAPGPGVFAPEQIDPAPFLELMTAHGTPWGVVDLPPDEELPV